MPPIMQSMSRNNTVGQMRDFPTAEEVMAMPYVRLLATLRESNRPPGGIDTIRQLAVNCHLRPGLKVLHAGCNAGFLSRELARRCGCSVLGVDISEDMVKSASDRAASEGVAHLVQHELQDTRALKLGDESFDVVLSGGALAFVDGQRKAVEEWVRVARFFGLVADAEFYYREQPPEQIRSNISEAIGVPVPNYERQHWLSLFNHRLLEPYYQHDATVVTRSESAILDYCESMVRHCAQHWTQSSQEALMERLLRLFNLFNENLRYMNYLILIYRRLQEAGEPSLFI